MANKTTNSAIDLLHEYCDKQIDLLGDFVADMYNTINKTIIWVFVLTLLASFGMSTILTHEVVQLKNRVQTIEQTWSE